MNEIKNLLDLGIEHVIIVVFTGAYAIQATLKIYEWFCDRLGIQTKWSIKKTEHIAMLESHDRDLIGMKEDLKLIKESLEKQGRQSDERTVASFRSTLYRLHADFTAQKYITQEGLKTFLEIGKVYESAGGDDIYHSKLEPEVLKLPLREGEESS